MSEQDLQQLNNEGESKRKKFNRVVDILLWVVIAVLTIAVLIRAFVFTQITVSGESMMETYHDKEVVSVSKVKKPQRGDVVIFYRNDNANKFLDVFSSGKTDEEGKYSKYIKRCVALGGDLLWVERVIGSNDMYKVLIKTPEGEKLYESSYKKDGETLSMEAFYIKGTLATGSDLGDILSQHIGEENALLIPDGYFFAMGDNRSNSSDSRTFGAVPLSRLFGVVVNA